MYFSLYSVCLFILKVWHFCHSCVKINKVIKYTFIHTLTKPVSLEILVKSVSVSEGRRKQQTH